MNSVVPSPLLRRSLLADAGVSAATGVLQLAAASSLAAMLELPMPLLGGTGQFMLCYAVLLLVLVTRQRIWRAAVAVIVVGNLAWAAAALLALLAGALQPTSAGVGFVLLQAAAVTLLAAFEWTGLRRSVPFDAVASEPALTARRESA